MKYLAVTLATILLVQQAACHAIATRDVSNSLSLDQTVDNTLDAATDIDAFLSLDQFILYAINVLENVPITRDVLAQLILFTNGFYGALDQITGVIDLVLNTATVLLSAFPFGALIPSFVRGLFRISLAEQTRVFVQFLFYRLWDALPKAVTDRYVVELIRNATDAAGKALPISIKVTMKQLV